MCGCATCSVDIAFGEEETVFDIDLTYRSYVDVDGVFEVWVRGTYPWAASKAWASRLAVGESEFKFNPDEPVDDFTVTVDSISESIISVTVVRCGRPFPLFVDVAISRRYGSDIFLDGQLNGIIESDEICIKYFRPEDGTVHNLPGELHDYIYLKDTSGTYSFEGKVHIPLWVRKIVISHWDDEGYTPSHYIDTCLPGVYALLVQDVSGTCETVIRERISHPFELIAPRYQYQVVFDPDDFDFPDMLNRLEARVSQWGIVESVGHIQLDRDCWEIKVQIDGEWESEYSHVWLCEAIQVEMDPTCEPMPWWLCSLPGIMRKYWRGECDCDAFQQYKKYGIPCVHLFAVLNAYGDEPARCPYIQCP